MPHGSPRDIDIIDAEFRVVGRSRWAAWMAQFPSKHDRFAFTCTATAPFALLGGLLLGFFDLAFFGAVLLCAVGCLASTEWKRYGVVGLVLAVLLATAGCRPLGTSDSASAAWATEKTKAPKEVQASIREATKYRDPRQSLTVKGIDVLNGGVATNSAKELKHEVR